MTFVPATTKLYAAGQQWVDALGNYQFEVIYQSGKSFIDVDGLCHIKWPPV